MPRGSILLESISSVRVIQSNKKYCFPSKMHFLFLVSEARSTLCVVGLEKFPNMVTFLCEIVLWISFLDWNLSFLHISQSQLRFSHLKVLQDWKEGKLHLKIWLQLQPKNIRNNLTASIGWQTELIKIMSIALHDRYLTTWSKSGIHCLRNSPGFRYL